MSEERQAKGNLIVWSCLLFLPVFCYLEMLCNTATEVHSDNEHNALHLYIYCKWKNVSLKNYACHLQFEKPSNVTSYKRVSLAGMKVE